MNYIENYKRDVKKEGIVDKKGRFDYISWAHAEKIANELDPDFDWNTSFEFLDLGLVEIEMKFKGKIRRHKYPILNNQNKPIEKPTSFDLNNAQMRGFAKLFSMMTGIGLSLFTGEDLQYLDNANKEPNKQQQSKGNKMHAEQQKGAKNGEQTANNVGLTPMQLLQNELKNKIKQHCTKNPSVQPKDVFSTLGITAKSTEEDITKAIEHMNDLLKGE